MKFRIKQQAVPIIAMVAFLLQVIIPFYAFYQLPKGNSIQQISSLFGDKFLLCTADGFKFVAWKDVLSGKEHPKPHQQYQCALCYVAAHGQGIQPEHASAASLAATASYDTILFSLSEDPFSSELPWRKLRTRSPPVSFIS